MSFVDHVLSAQHAPCLGLPYAPRFAVRPSATLEATERSALAELAAAVAPGVGSGDYVLQRFDGYPLVLTAAEGRGRGFALLDAFTERCETHVYVGPMFSHGGAAALMVAGLVRGLMSNGERAFHLAAEVQNPVIIELLERLVPSAVYPRRGPHAIPCSVRRAAGAFARHIGHIHGFDPTSWRTRSQSTLYEPAAGRGPIVAWLAARGVELDRGDAQLVIVTCPREQEPRERVRRELARGLASLRRAKARTDTHARPAETSHV